VAAIIQAPPGPTSASPTHGRGISPNGRYVVGDYSFDAVGAAKAFYFDMQTQQFTPLPLLPGTFTSTAYDVNDVGQIVGMIASPAGERGFVYSIATGQYTLLEPIDPQGACRARGITSTGVVCGSRSMGSKGNPVHPMTAFRWSASTGYIDFGIMNGPNSEARDIAEDGTVVGWTGSGEFTVGTRGFVWRDSGLTVLPPIPGGTSSALHGVNTLSSGILACGRGRKQLPGEGLTSETFSWDGQTMTLLGALPGTTIGFAFDVASDGSVVGFCRSLQPTHDRPYVWRGGTIIDLTTMLRPDAALNEIKFAEAISNTGLITGDGALPAGHVVAFALAPVYGNAGDVDSNCRTDVDDLILVILEWGNEESPADANNDGVVDVDDLVIVILNWSR
jgi:uncharacterized membrane protein